MAIIYAELIIKGYKELEDVPARLRSRVAELIDGLNGEDENV